MDSLIDMIDGAWLGRYDAYIAGRFLPSFKARFHVTGDLRTFTGKIYDVGPGGDAEVTGTHYGRRIQFTATYLAATTETKVSESLFDGLLSDDGDSISGNWVIKNGFFRSVSGPWQVFRVNSRRAVEVRASWPPPPVRAYGKSL
jgi:hypothetical protein